MRYNLITVVWGDEYTGLFADIVMPNLLSPGNLYALGKGSSVVYRIYTTAKGAQRIKGSVSFLAIAAKLEHEFNIIEEKDFANKYSIMSRCHKMALNAIGDKEELIIFLPPDAILSEGSLVNAIDVFKSGKRAVMIAGLRVAKDTFLPEFLAKFSNNGVMMPVSSRELFKLAFKHLHPISKTFFWDSKTFYNAPSHIFFNVPEEGILARCFHLHPILINSLNSADKFTTTIDGDYIRDACPDIDDIYIMSDSDKFLSIEMSSLSMQVDAGSRPANPLNIAAFAKYSTTGHNRSFIRNKIRFHFDDISSRWTEVERLSDESIDRIFYWFKFEPLLIWPYGIAVKMKYFARSVVKLFFGESFTKRLAQRLRSVRRGASIQRGVMN
ncbi:MAG: hypothetical protein NTY47_01970 [Candidatus Omnitrophica bacterium]|nr:hypothetical protein [Candidatus Omnitrophota bacterium]